MKLSVLNIKNQEFNTSIKGYNREEVNAFLERVADEFEILISETEQLKKENDFLKEQNKKYKKIEEHLQNTLVSAQETSSKAVESAKKQTALIIREAELRANQIVEKAKLDANLIREAVIRLREEKNIIIAKLKAIVETQAGLLEGESVETVVVKDDIRSYLNKTEINVDSILEKLI
ncbi:MAG TPA: DivIVA domain-containing protein [Melioribacteraceae bacterium]|nr:DivIVA domain-containing protein [Melioribacteraceae bacterium]